MRCWFALCVAFTPHTQALLLRAVLPPLPALTLLVSRLAHAPTPLPRRTPTATRKSIQPPTSSPAWLCLTTYTPGSLLAAFASYFLFSFPTHCACKNLPLPHPTLLPLPVLDGSAAGDAPYAARTTALPARLHTTTHTTTTHYSTWFAHWVVGDSGFAYLQF